MTKGQNIFSIVLLFFLFQACGFKGEKGIADNERPSGVGIYKQECSACHGSSGNLMMGGAKDLTKSTLELSEIQSIIRSGKGTMPAYGEKMSPAEIEALAEYVQALAK